MSIKAPGERRKGQQLARISVTNAQSPEQKWCNGVVMARGPELATALRRVCRNCPDHPDIEKAKRLLDGIRDEIQRGPISRRRQAA